MERLGLFVLALALTLCLAAGCGSKDKKDTSAGGADGAEVSTLTGKLDEVKDFMFTVTDDAGEAYVFTLKDGDKPQGLEDVAAGDTVTVTYTGTLSVVDGLDGATVSVEKSES